MDIDRRTKKWKRVEVFLEFLVFGIAFGVVEDLIAVTATTDASITPKLFGIIVLIAIPFAFFGEVLVDQVDFVKMLERFVKKENDHLGGNQPPRNDQHGDSPQMPDSG